MPHSSLVLRADGEIAARLAADGHEDRGHDAELELLGTGCADVGRVPQGFVQINARCEEAAVTVGSGNRSDPDLRMVHLFAGQEGGDVADARLELVNFGDDQSVELGATTGLAWGRAR